MLPFLGESVLDFLPSAGTLSSLPSFRREDSSVASFFKEEDCILPCFDDDSGRLSSEMDAIGTSYLQGLIVPFVVSEPSGSLHRVTRICS